MQTFLLIVAATLLANTDTVFAGEVRCFCNLPSCVMSGYMCKSAMGGCFSDLFDFQDVYKARHGCVELLHVNRQSQCQNEPGSRRTHPRSLLLCCKSDMCNHVDSPEIRLRVNDSFLVPNSTDPQPRITTTNHHNKNMLNANSNAANNSNEVWFKAAMIAVPICGAVILFLLIALAVKILRTETRSTPKQVGDWTVKKVPLLHVASTEKRVRTTQYTTYECAPGFAYKAPQNNLAKAGNVTQNSAASVHKPSNAYYHNLNVAEAHDARTCCKHSGDKQNGANLPAHV